MPAKRAPLVTAARLPMWARDEAPEGLEGERLADWYFTLEQGRQIGITQAAGEVVDLDPVIEDQRKGVQYVTQQIEALARALDTLTRGMSALLQSQRAPLSSSAIPAHDRRSTVSGTNGQAVLASRLPGDGLTPLTNEEIAAEVAAQQDAVDLSEEGYEQEDAEAEDAETDQLTELDDLSEARLLEFVEQLMVTHQPGRPEAIAKARDVVLEMAQGMHFQEGQKVVGVPWKQLPGRNGEEWKTIVYNYLGRYGLVPLEAKAPDPEID